MVGFQGNEIILFLLQVKQKKLSIEKKGSSQLVKQYGLERELLFDHHPKFSQFCMGNKAVFQPHIEHPLGWQ